MNKICLRRRGFTSFWVVVIGVDHVVDSVALEQAVLSGWWLILELFHYETLKLLHLLVSRSSHFQ